MGQSSRKTVRYRGKEYPILESIRIGDRTYSLIERIARQPRMRYKAICSAAPPDERKCAVLLLSREQASLQHVNVLRRLSRRSPSNLPRIISYAKWRDDVAVAVNWVEGVSLDAYLQDADEGVLTCRSPTNIMRCHTGLALGLRQLHSHAGLIHGDLKPGNLVLTGKPQRLVMIDFGSAWMKMKTMHRQSSDGETEPYAAPEQLFDGPPVYEAIDQFSASVVAYELMTGQLPYGGMGGRAGLPDKIDVYERQWKPPSKLSPHRSDVPKRIWNRIDTILKRALSLDPENRYPTDDAWLEDLNALRSEIDRKAEAVSENHWMLKGARLLSRIMGR
jgi:serine/threonine protein kinase